MRPPLLGSILLPIGFALLLGACGKDAGPADTDTTGPKRVLEGPFAGQRLAVSADLGGDAVPDLVLSAPGLDGSGGIYLFQADLTGTVAPQQATGRVVGGAPGDIGEGLSACGDLDGDGQGDLAIGMPSGNSSRGGVWLVSGPIQGDIPIADLPSIRGVDPDGGAGYSVDCRGDFDGDGRADIALAAPFADGFGLGEGAGQVFFHRSTDEGPDAVATFSTTFLDEALGSEQSISLSADLNGDGLDDAVMGGPGVSRVHVLFAPYAGTYDGNSAGISFDGREDDDQFGSAVAVGDLDGDGSVDLAAGAPYFGAQLGAVGVISGPFDDSSGGRVSTVGRWIDGQDPKEYTGSSVAIADDLDGDGLADLLTGAPGATTNGPQAGVVYGILGPAPGITVLLADRVIVGTTPHAQLGASLVAVPDVTGDGLSEVLIGAPTLDVDQRVGVGGAFLFHSPLPDRIEDGAASTVFLF